MVETQFSTKLKSFRSNGGGEFTSPAFKLFLTTHGIHHQVSCPSTPQQNGLVERKHRHLIETSITLLAQAQIPNTYWTYAIQTTVNLINLLPTAVLQFQSPWSILNHKPPDLSQLKVVGCACYPFLRPYTTHKLDPRTKECIFLGYSTTSKGYLCFDPTTNTIYTSRHVLFNESKFPFPTLTHTSDIPSPIQSNQAWFSNFLYFHSSNQPSLLSPVPTTTTQWRL